MVTPDGSDGPGGISFVLNGSPVEVRNDHPHLLAALREELGVTSPKDGCSPSGQCGCCTVLVDDKAVVACQVALSRARGRSVVTLEGFDPAERQRFAAAFVAAGALQCGFCTPGMILSAKALLDENPDPTDEEIRKGLEGNFCRCTGYTKIIESIRVAAERMKG